MPWLDKKMMELASRLMGLGVTLGVYVIAGIGAGWCVEHFLGIKDWGYVVFILIGFLLGMYKAYLALQKIRSDESSESPESPTDPEN
jgi:F0F1-type ATP synthase assembly protein I